MDLRFPSQPDSGCQIQLSAIRTLTLSTGAPQGCVLYTLLFTLFTNDCRSSSSSKLIFKFPDDTTIEGLITNADESAYREEVEQVVDWCTTNDLELNEANTKEMITDFEEEQDSYDTISYKRTTSGTCGFIQIPGHYHHQHIKMGHQC